MHRDVFQEFERICLERGAGGDVLEVGAVASEDSLLCLTALAGARSKVGINIEGAKRFRDFEILPVNANQMRCFEDASFDTVLCNSVLEHDRYFWRTLAEIRRVARSGALLVIGVPGFGALPVERVFDRLGRLPFADRFLPGVAVSTPVLRVHAYPSDYYRFTPEAMREVFLEGLSDIEVRTIMVPPRVIGVGRKP